MPTPVSFMGTRLSLAGKQEALEVIEKGGPAKIATPNPEFMLEAEKNSAFRMALEGMDCCIVDGSGLYFGLWLQRILGNHKLRPERYTGADLAADLFERYQDGSRRFYLVGGKEGLAAAAAPRLLELYPGLRIVGAEGGGMISPAGIAADSGLNERIRKAKPDILMVGFGAPRQELWITENFPSLEVPVAIGVGGTFGFYTDKRRAPRLLRSLRLEWLYRGFTEKGHWPRAWKATAVYASRLFVWLLKRNP